MNKNKQTKSLKRLLTMAGLVIITAASSQVQAQNGVGINPTGAAAHPSAALDVSATNKGVLVPRMTAAEKAAIASPANGLLIFQTDGVSGFWYYNATTSAWVQAVGPQGPQGQGGVTTAGTNITILGAGTVGSPYVINYSTPTYTLGLYPELGGYVFYVTSDGKHGLVAETQDQGSASWYEAQNFISNPAFHSANGQKFTDWRLPTKYELFLMYFQRNSIGGFSSDVFNGAYWSSTEYDNLLAWLDDFYVGPSSSSLSTSHTVFVQ